MQLWVVPFSELDSTLRKIAKSTYWQMLFAQVKEVTGMQLFHNINDFTYLQICFVNHLAFYSAIQTDISTGEVSDIVLKDPIYEEAYWMYRTDKQMKSVKKNKQTDTTITPLSTGGEQVVNRNQWAFTKVKGVKK